MYKIIRGNMKTRKRRSNPDGSLSKVMLREQIAFATATRDAMVKLSGATSVSPPVTKTEHAALAEVKRIHGLPWRARLRKAWEDGTVSKLVGAEGPVSTLARLKTKLGPSGLAAYRFPKDC